MPFNSINVAKVIKQVNDYVPVQVVLSAKECTYIKHPILTESRDICFVPNSTADISFVSLPNLSSVVVLHAGQFVTDDDLLRNLKTRVSGEDLGLFHESLANLVLENSYTHLAIDRNGFDDCYPFAYHLVDEIRDYDISILQKHKMVGDLLAAIALGKADLSQVGACTLVLARLRALDVKIISFEEIYKGANYQLIIQKPNGHTIKLHYIQYDTPGGFSLAQRCLLGPFEQAPVIDTCLLRGLGRIKDDIVLRGVLAIIRDMFLVSTNPFAGRMHLLSSDRYWSSIDGLVTHGLVNKTYFKQVCMGGLERAEDSEVNEPPMFFKNRRVSVYPPYAHSRGRWTVLSTSKEFVHYGLAQQVIPQKRFTMPPKHPYAHTCESLAKELACVYQAPSSLRGFSLDISILEKYLYNYTWEVKQLLQRWYGREFYLSLCECFKKFKLDDRFFILFLQPGVACRLLEFYQFLEEGGYESRVLPLPKFRSLFSRYLGNISLFRAMYLDEKQASAFSTGNSAVLSYGLLHDANVALRVLNLLFSLNCDLYDANLCREDSMIDQFLKTGSITFDHRGYRSDGGYSGLFIPGSQYAAVCYYVITKFSQHYCTSRRKIYFIEYELPRIETTCSRGPFSISALLINNFLKDIKTGKQYQAKHYEHLVYGHIPSSCLQKMYRLNPSIPSLHDDLIRGRFVLGDQGYADFTRRYLYGDPLSPEVDPERGDSVEFLEKYAEPITLSRASEVQRASVLAEAGLDKHAGAVKRGTL